VKILLFGATGCFGTAFTRSCTEAGHDFVGLSHDDVEATDADAVGTAIRDFRPDAVVNAVAIVGINPCEEDPARAYAVNTTAANSMMKAAKEIGAAFVQTSTHAVFDGRKIDPYVESDRPNAPNVYGVSKLAAEILAEGWCEPWYVARFPTMYGPRRNRSPGFVDKVLNWLANGQELRIADDKIDSPTFALDAARRVLELVTERADSGVYHVANDGQVSYHEFISRLAERLGYRDSTIHAVKDAEFAAPAPKPLHTALASEKLPALRSWEDAMDAFLAELASA
jgi:dTDP-4-dehydrorhamnose reductase